MLTFHTESSKPWTVESIKDDTLVKISRTNEISKKRLSAMDEVPAITSRTVSIVSHKSMFGEAGIRNLETKLNSIASDIHHPVITIDTESEHFVSFNRKTLRPFLLDSKTKKKDILFTDLQLRGRKVVNIQLKDVFLLEYYLFNGEFAFIASFNSYSSEMRVSLLDSETGRINEYIYGYNGDHSETIWCTIVHKDAEQGHLYEKALIEKFRPNRATYAIIVMEEEYDSLQNVLDKNANHEIFIVGQGQLAGTIEGLKDDFYKAVTIYTNTPSNRKDDEGVVKRYDPFISEIEEQFPIVYRLYKDKRIEKLRKY